MAIVAALLKGATLSGADRAGSLPDGDIGDSIKELKGAAKEPLGQAVGDAKLQSDGEADKCLLRVRAGSVRIGLLYLRHGRWGDKQIIPAEWIDRSTKAYSTTDRNLGDGFLWWIVPPDPPAALASPAGPFFALGAGDQYVIIIPAYDLVVVHLARTKRDKLGGQLGVSLSQMSHLLTLILAARPDAG